MSARTYGAACGTGLCSVPASMGEEQNTGTCVTEPPPSTPETNTALRTSCTQHEMKIKQPEAINTTPYWGCLATFPPTLASAFVFLGNLCAHSLLSAPPPHAPAHNAAANGQPQGLTWPHRLCRWLTRCLPFKLWK